MRRWRICLRVIDFSFSSTAQIIKVDRGKLGGKGVAGCGEDDDEVYVC